MSILLFRRYFYRVDLDTFTIKARVRFPKFHMEGRYKVDATILSVPLKGQGNMMADAGKLLHFKGIIALQNGRKCLSQKNRVKA